MEQWQCGRGEVEVDAVRVLAQAEYEVGDHPQAFRHWYQLLLASRDSAGRYMAFFDSLVKQHPAQPELKLCLALSHLTFARGLTLRFWRYEEGYMSKLDVVERQLPQRFEVNFFRAIWLLEFGERERALAQLDVAVAKEPALPVLYLHRYLLRLHQKQVLSIANDPEYSKYRARCAGWD